MAYDGSVVVRRSSVRRPSLSKGVKKAYLKKHPEIAWRIIPVINSFHRDRMWYRDAKFSVVYEDDTALRSNGRNRITIEVKRLEDGLRTIYSEDVSREDGLWGDEYSLLMLGDEEVKISG